MDVPQAQAGIASAEASAAQRLSQEPTPGTTPEQEQTPSPAPQPAAPEEPTPTVPPQESRAPAGEDYLEVPLSDGTVEKVRRQDSIELNRWAIETLRRAREESQAQQESRSPSRSDANQQPADPVAARLEKIERAFEARERREQTRELLGEIDGAIAKSEIFKNFKGQELEYARGLVATGIVSGNGISVEKAVKRLEEVFGSMTGRNRAQYVEEKLDQAATRPLPRAAPATTPSKPMGRAALANGQANASALNRLRRAMANT